MLGASFSFEISDEMRERYQNKHNGVETAISSILRGCLCLLVDGCLGKLCHIIKLESATSRSMMIFNNF